MKVLTDVWKRKNKATGKTEYIGAYKYYSGKSKKRELALITKSTYNFFRKHAKFTGNELLKNHRRKILKHS